MQVPSQVWVGSAQTLKKEAINFLQKELCKEGGCGSCLVCRQIFDEQFHNILWLLPEGQYKVDQVREVVSRLSLMLAPDEKFYFVFQNAHCLNSSGANSLLKSIEEPPLGYNFIFLTPRKELIIPTILSRSTIKNFGVGEGSLDNELYQSFTIKKLNPIEFFAVLEKNKHLTDQDNRELLDQIYSYWIEQYKKATDSKIKNEIRSKINCLQKLLNTPPMPGSGKVFWKELYLNFY